MVAAVIEVPTGDNTDLEISRFAWIPTSMKALEDAERRLLSFVKCQLIKKFVPVMRGQSQVWTITAPEVGGSALDAAGRRGSGVSQKGPKRWPLVMVHGFGAGVGLWVSNLDALSKRRTVHTFDLLGFGRSSRVPFSSEPAEAEAQWVQSIEDWREQMGLEKFVLLGHSLGGYVASSYALSHPDRVRHLILADPWGFPIRPPDLEQQARLPTWARTIASVLQHFNPLASVRAVGPFGPSMIRRFRPDLGRKFAIAIGDEDAMFDYIYHSNAQNPTGESAFKSMQIPFGWAKLPMIERMKNIPENLPITFIYGDRSWMERGTGYEVQLEIRKRSYVNVEVIQGAGHHVYVDKVDEFNEIVENACAVADENRDQLQQS